MSEEIEIIKKGVVLTEKYTFKKKDNSIVLAINDTDTILYKFNKDKVDFVWKKIKELQQLEKILCIIQQNCIEIEMVKA